MQDVDIYQLIRKINPQPTSTVYSSPATAMESEVGTDRRPRNWWSFILCISNRNNTQELDSETRDRRTRAESDKQEQKNKSDSEGTIEERNNPRKNNFSTNPGNFSEHYIFFTQNRGYVLNTRTPSLI